MEEKKDIPQLPEQGKEELAEMHYNVKPWSHHDVLRM